MNYKLEILKALDLLGKFDLDRRRIEEELGYSERYLDQVLSKGGSKMVLNRLLQLKEKYELQNATSEVRENDEISKYLIEREEEKQNKNGKSIAQKDISSKMPEEVQKELGDVAKGGEMTAMFLSLIEHLQTISASLKETREIARENNSLVRTVLLNQSKSSQYNEIDGAEKRFQASLEVARTLLKQTFSHT